MKGNNDSKHHSNQKTIFTIKIYLFQSIMKINELKNRSFRASKLIKNTIIVVPRIMAREAIRIQYNVLIWHTVPKKVSNKSRISANRKQLI
jgi:hypothetical protein